MSSGGRGLLRSSSVSGDEPRHRRRRGYITIHPMRSRLAKAEKEGPLTRKLLITAAIAVIALTPSIGIGIAEADGMASFHGGVVHGAGIHHGVIHRHGFLGARGFPRNGFGYPGIIGYADPEAAAEAPPVLPTPQPSPAVAAVDHPPCHETTTEGVVIMRGAACSRGSH
jgi:hypothetical protein